MTILQVKIWFQNRRMKWKRTKKGSKERKDEQNVDEDESKLEIDESDPVSMNPSHSEAANHMNCGDADIER